ncbi:putative HTH-type transcriptional regulator [Mycobacterium noviomagense]|uniref:LysR family transcriptional regulator n=1 Tax=Mycobacterium noviomagense TaxID=459858 RepID=A0A7I7PIU1_9MYCO|nr:LysR family transcriptional regulator [Mycobacterium noviomagense]BBY08548.1 putative HTH-type transcriptional regulator [Mycobacterium noviomagense]
MALSSRMPELASFEILLAIAKTGSLGGAARELGLTQQAVSARLASMEAQIGVGLAVRTTRGSTLTPAGVLVAEWAARLVEVAREVDAGLGSLRAKSRQRIKVVASQTIAEQIMPHWLVSLQAAATRGGSTAPEVILTATNSENAIALVRDGTADLGFVENPFPPRGLGSCVVAHDELVVVVPPGHKWARRSRVVSAAELAQTPLVTREPRSGIRDSLTVALRRALGDDMRQAPPVLELTSAAAMRAAVLAGAGPAAMSRLAVADDLAVGRLCAITVPELSLRRQLRAIWVGGRTPPAGAIRELLSHIRTRTPTARKAGHQTRIGDPARFGDAQS